MALAEKKNSTISTTDGLIFDENFKDYKSKQIPVLACVIHTGLGIYNVLCLAVWVFGDNLSTIQQ